MCIRDRRRAASIFNSHPSRITNRRESDSLDPSIRIAESPRHISTRRQTPCSRPRSPAFASPRRRSARRRARSTPPSSRAAPRRARRRKSPPSRCDRARRREIVSLPNARENSATRAKRTRTRAKPRWNESGRLTMDERDRTMRTGGTVRVARAAGLVPGVRHVPGRRRVADHSVRR